MYCKNCGFQLQEDDIICKSCGTKVETSLLEDTIEVLEQPTVTPKVDSQIQSIPMASNYIPPQTSMMKDLNQPNVMNGENPIEKKKNKSIFIIIGVIVVVVILAVILILKLGSKPSDKVVNDNTEVNNVTETVDDQEDVEPDVEDTSFGAEEEGTISPDE
jgi:uncharacterized membrane protein YvbJ